MGAPSEAMVVVVVVGVGEVIRDDGWKRRFQGRNRRSDRMNNGLSCFICKGRDLDVSGEAVVIVRAVQ